MAADLSAAYMLMQRQRSEEVFNVEFFDDVMNLLSEEEIAQALHNEQAQSLCYGSQGGSYSSLTPAQLELAMALQSGSACAANGLCSDAHLHVKAAAANNGPAKQLSSSNSLSSSYQNSGSPASPMFHEPSAASPASSNYTSESLEERAVPEKKRAASKRSATSKAPVDPAVRQAQRAINKRNLNREAQRRFRNRQKAAMNVLEDCNKGQIDEISELRLANRMAEEQYNLLLAQYKSLQVKCLQLQMRSAMPVY